MAEIIDALGRELAPGDPVSFVQYNTLFFGEIIKFTDASIMIRHKNGWKAQPSRSVTIEVEGKKRLRNICKITEHDFNNAPET